MLRASDSDREHIAERLRKATAEGRLVAEELEERLGAALRARTYGELDALVADLPRERQPRRLGHTVLAVLVGVMVMLAVLAAVALIVTGLFTGWLLWAVIGWWFFGRRHGGWHGRRRGYYGPSSRGRMYGSWQGNRGLYRA